MSASPPTVPRMPRRRIVRWFFGIVLAFGIACILYPIVTNVAYQMGAYNAVASYDEAVGRRTPEELARLWADAYAYNDELSASEVRDPFAVDEVTAPLDRYFDVLDPDGTGMMGYVEAPSIGLELPLYHGTGDEVLQKGAGHIATTALPIEGDSIHPVITGHTGLPDKLLFTNLMFLKTGDVFRVKILDRTFSYTISSIDVVEPDDTALLQPVAGADELTLLTCTPYGINSQRLLVTGAPATEGDRDGARPVPLAIVAAVALAVVAGGRGDHGEEKGDAPKGQEERVSLTCSSWKKRASPLRHGAALWNVPKRPMILTDGARAESALPRSLSRNRSAAC